MSRLAGLFFLFSISALAAFTARSSAYNDPVPFRKAEAMRTFRIASPAGTLAPQPTPNQLSYDVLHYDLDVAIEPYSRFIEGRVQLEAVSLLEGLSSIDLDADAALEIASVTDTLGSPLQWNRSFHILTINLAQGLSEGDTFCIEIRYSGYPSSSTYPGLFFGQAGGQPVIYSLSEPWSARAWWPCKDYPDDKATFDLFFSVPSNLTATSNGKFLGTSDEIRWGQPYRRWHWRENFPMTTYLASVTAALYVCLEDEFCTAYGDTMPVTHYVYPWLETQARTDFSIAVPALQFFSDAFGLYPFISEKFGVALCPLGGGMEHQTLTSYGSSLVRGDHYYDWVYVHELAHQWFGDLVTCRNWIHIWLNEGFASYAEALWFEHLQGQTKLRTYMESQDRPSTWHGSILREPDVPDPWYYFDNVVYDKAAWVLHMLRHIVGDDAFFGALRDYCSDPRYRYSVAETADFAAICEARYGSSLDWFFDPWLRRVDRLTYEYSYSAYERWDGMNLTISVNQVQDSLYTMPVDFRISTSLNDIDTTFWVDDRHEEFHIAFASGTTVQNVSLDPDHWILCDKNLVLTDASVPPLSLFLDQNVPNPFNPVTRIRFGLSRAGRVELRVYSILGSLEATLAVSSFEAGEHEILWNGTNDNGEALQSGVYIMRLVSNGEAVSRKMVIVR